MSPSLSELESWFWSMAFKAANGCWEWMGTRSPRGYGKLSVLGEMVTAARLGIYFITGHWAKPYPQISICHTCDNPSCINPSHLFLGTHKQNMEDCKLKGRMRGQSGEAHPLHKLTKNQVIYIRELAGAFRNVDLARLCNVTPTLIGNVIKRKVWTHI